MTYSGLAVGLADELYAALRNSTTQYNLCFTASVSVREASHLYSDDPVDLEDVLRGTLDFFEIYEGNLQEVSKAEQSETVPF